jgi:hypothetical protein
VTPSQPQVAGVLEGGGPEGEVGGRGKRGGAREETAAGFEQQRQVAG